MDQKVYHIAEFARKASVSVRALRYYEKTGLLIPSLFDKSGYKLYTDSDFITLQSILSFKFLDFSLKDIQSLLHGNEYGLQEKLALQKKMIKEKRTQMSRIIEAIERVEKAIQMNSFNLESITDLIQVTQMDLKPEWVNKYLTTEERQTMRKIAIESYSKETLQQLAERGWTEEDHKRHVNDYQTFRTKLTMLVDEGYTPKSSEAQALAKFLINMNKRYSQNDPKIQEGMRKSWEKLNSLPENEKPKTYVIPEKESEFIKGACRIYYRNLKG